MAHDSVMVKQEPADLGEETENGPTFSPSSNLNEPEFINIKMEIEEIEVAVPSISVKSDLAGPASPSPSRPKTWHVPIVNEATVVPDCVEIPIKQEIDDNDTELDEPVPDGEIPATSNSEDMEYRPDNSGRSFVCHKCKKTFANPGNLQRHLLLHNRQTINCTQCNTQFLNKIKLERHIFTKHTLPTDRAFPCDVCQKGFKSSSNLMQHKKIHLKEKPFQCPTCLRSFTFKTNLNKHQGKSRCKPTVDPLICNVCEKVFQKEYLLKSHLRKHDTERPFSCDKCATTFKYKSTLIRHVQLHNGVKPFSCPVCNKTFTTSGLLKPHMRIHTGEKPYQCQICSKNFTHKHNMQRHMLRHNKIKHLVCDVCHKEFPRESRLKYHMKTHVNEKHFICHVCPKRFSHKQNVLRHYTRKHPGQTYNCTDTDASVALKVWDTIKSKYYDDEAEVILG